MKKILLFLLFAIAFSGCGKDDEKNIRMTVASERVEHDGNDGFIGYRYAYIVKFSKEADWEFLSGPIHGFDYEPGYEYEIEVREIHIDPAFQDRPSVERELIRVLSKIPKQSENLPEY